MSVTVKGRSKSEVARDYKISRYWVQQLVRRYEAEGPAAFVARSRRSHTNPRAISLDLEDRIVRMRKSLSKEGLDAGAETIRAHLATACVERLPATSTIWRVLTRRGFVTAQPRKRPKGAGEAVLRRATQRTLASRHHPLAARRRHRRGDPQHQRRWKQARPGRQSGS